MTLSGKTYHLDISLSKVFRLLIFKVISAFHRLLDIIHFLPIRFIRFLQHLSRFPAVFKSFTAKSSSPSGQFVSWFFELAVLFLDMLGFSEIYESLLDLLKFNTRPMHRWEIEMARTVFGNSINYRRVRIDEHAICGPRQYRFAYVSFYTINSWGPMHNSFLLHELTHVWQYERLGAVYIPRALRAQFSEPGYNYGGASNLRNQLEAGNDFSTFNLEQQGDIVSDYFRIKGGYHPQWGRGSVYDLPVYEAFIAQLKV